jgi:malonyl-CoA O-methyltransferase
MTVDKGLVRARFGRSLGGYDEEAAVQKGMAAQLAAAIVRHGGDDHRRVLEIGCGTGLLSRALAGALRIETFDAVDLVPECGPLVADELKHHPAVVFNFRPGDVERLELPPASFDLVASNAVFHWLGDLAGLLERIADALPVGGLLAFTSFGPDNLLEIAALGEMGLRYRSLEEVSALLERRFGIRGREERREVLRFSSPRRALDHLRRTGANGLERTGWTRGKLRSFETRYRERFGSGDAVTLTYHPLLFVAEKR